jgi:TonB family protein
MPFIYALLSIPIYIGSLCWAPQVFPEEFSDSEIETLDVIEVTGESVKTTAREYSFPLPVFPAAFSERPNHVLPLPEIQVNHPHPRTSQVLIDQTGKTRGIVTPVKPLKTERPPYPRKARESGWQGRVVLQLNITSHGRVMTAAIHESSGYSMLDNSAIQAAKNWTFVPAKNGEPADELSPAYLLLLVMCLNLGLQPQTIQLCRGSPRSARSSLYGLSA